jgi:hypothetical protein
MPPGGRPVGVIILAILYLLNAVVVFAMVGLLMVWGALEAGGAAIICLAPFILFGVFFLLIAFGLYAMRTWAWTVALVFAILGLLGAIGILVSVGSVAGDADIPGSFLTTPAANLVINLIIIVYLIKVKDHFR